jgi:malate dehydrogenase (quinone)
MKTDVLLIGSGIMSSTLGVMLRELNPALSVQLYEVAEKPAQEASNGWNNAGTGHAGICELSYTPKQEEDGTVDVSKAISVFEDFEHSLQF